MADDDPQRYQVLIDALVRECRQGQGQIGACKARRGIWNPNPDAILANVAPEQRRINELLAGMAEDDREVLARMLADAFQGGVFIALRVLHDHQVPPFEDGYEGTPFNDFVGRLDEWPWPKHSHPSDGAAQRAKGLEIYTEAPSEATRDALRKLGDLLA